jgi:hypothetical protein
MDAGRQAGSRNDAWRVLLGAVLVAFKILAVDKTFDPLL